MKIKYLGTAAFEGVPALFCDCEACRYARKNGGKDIRTRSQALIDENIIVDFPADTYLHFLQTGIDFNKFKTLLVTHSHSDHLYPSDLEIKSVEYTSQKKVVPLNIYVGENGGRMIRDTIAPIIDDKQINLFTLAPFESFYADGYKITPVPASHDWASSPFVFIIEKDGKAMYYGNDTGALKKETLEKLATLDVKFDLISMDCNFIEIDPAWECHMNKREVLELIAFFQEHDMLKENCKKVVTHFSHNSFVVHEGYTLHGYLESIFNEYGIEVAYDGFEVEF